MSVLDDFFEKFTTITVTDATTHNSYDNRYIVSNDVDILILNSDSTGTDPTTTVLHVSIDYLTTPLEIQKLEDSGAVRLYAEEGYIRGAATTSYDPTWDGTDAAPRYILLEDDETFRFAGTDGIPKFEYSNYGKPRLLSGLGLPENSTSLYEERIDRYYYNRYSSINNPGKVYTESGINPVVKIEEPLILLDGGFGTWGEYQLPVNPTKNFIRYMMFVEAASTNFDFLPEFTKIVSGAGNNIVRYTDSSASWNAYLYVIHQYRYDGTNWIENVMSLDDYRSRNFFETIIPVLNEPRYLDTSYDAPFDTKPSSIHRKFLINTTLLPQTMFLPSAALPILAQAPNSNFPIDIGGEYVFFDMLNTFATNNVTINAGIEAINGVVGVPAIVTQSTRVFWSGDTSIGWILSNY